MENKDNEQSFPGYPHYPAGEDITNAENNAGKEELSEDETYRENKVDDFDVREADTQFVSGTDADVTGEDLRMLDAAEQNMDSMDSENLMASSLDNVDEDGDPLNEVNSLADDMAGTDLDVPGSGADDADERIGEEDEENNYYSLGGDNHEAQEENKGE